LPRGVVRYERDDSVLGDPERLLATRPDAIAALVADAVAREWPIHVDEIVRLIASRFGARATSRPRAAIEVAIAAAVRAGSVGRRGEFLVKPGAEAPPVRYRGGKCAVTKTELISPDELAEAVHLALSVEFGLKRDGVVAAAARLMGFARTGPNLSARFDEAVAALLASGDIAEDAAGFLVLTR
jgi:hypothetical protein